MKSPFLSLLTTVFLMVLFSQNAASKELNMSLVNCVYSELELQFPIFEHLELNYVKSAIDDPLNWKLVIQTQFRDGQDDIFSISVKNGDYSSALLLIDGLKDQALDLHNCLRHAL